MNRTIVPVALIVSTVGLCCCLVSATPKPPHPQSNVQGSPGCNVSKPIWAEPPKLKVVELGYRDWIVNEDRTIWFPNDKWVSGDEGNKVVLIRPAGTKLIVSGRLLEATAPPLKATEDRGYPWGFTVLGIYFPTEGCWEVNAKAGDSEIKFVTQISPQTVRISPGAPDQPALSRRTPALPLALPTSASTLLTSSQY